MFKIKNIFLLINSTLENLENMEKDKTKKTAGRKDNLANEIWQTTWTYN